MQSISEFIDKIAVRVPADVIQRLEEQEQQHRPEQRLQRTQGSVSNIRVNEVMTNSGNESPISSSRSPTSDKPGYGLCRICHSTEPLHKLLSPCFCKGSLLYVHRGCLEHWLEAKSTDTCELCHYQYVTEKRPMSFQEWIRLAGGMERRRLVADVCCSLTLTPMTLTSVALLFNSTAHFSAGNPRPVVFYLLLALASLILVLYIYWVSNTIRSHWNSFRMWRMTHFHVKLVLGVCNLDRSQTALEQTRTSDILMRQQAEPCCAHAEGSPEVPLALLQPTVLMSDETYCRSPESVLMSSATQASRSLASLNNQDEGPETGANAAATHVVRFPTGDLIVTGEVKMATPIYAEEVEAMAKLKADSHAQLERVLGRSIECLANADVHNPFNTENSDDIRRNKFCHDVCCDPWEIQGVASMSPHDGGRITWRKVITCRHQQQQLDQQQLEPEKTPSVITILKPPHERAAAERGRRRSKRMLASGEELLYQSCHLHHHGAPALAPAGGSDSLTSVARRESPASGTDQYSSAEDCSARSDNARVADSSDVADLAQVPELDASKPAAEAETDLNAAAEPDTS